MCNRRPLVLSVRPDRELCGVTYWAKHLEEELEALGVVVRGVTHSEFLRQPRNSADGLVLHVEIGADTKNCDFFRAMYGIRRTGISHRRCASVIHSVFTPAQLQLSWPLADLAIAYQWQAFKLLRRLSTLITLSEATHAQLAQRGIENEELRPGIYTSYLVERSNPAPRDAGSRALIGLIGHPYATKQYDKAVDAFALLPDELRKKARIVVLGGDPKADPTGASRLRASLEKLSPEEKAVTGSLDEQAFSDWLDRLDLALMPYVDRTSSSAVYSRVVGHHIPAITTSQSLFQPLIAAGGAIAVDDWPAGAVDVLSKILLNREQLEAMRRGASVLSETDSVRNVASRILTIVGIPHAPA